MKYLSAAIVFLLGLSLAGHAAAQGLVVSTIANASSAGASFQPDSVAVDSTGNLYMVVNESAVDRISSAGVQQLYAGSLTQNAIVNGPALSAQFGQPVGIAIDSAGNIYVADYGVNVIRKIDTTGLVSTFAGTGHFGSNDGPGSTATFNLPYAVAVDGAGYVYVADRDNGSVRKIDPSGNVTTLASDIPPTYAQGIAVDSQGNVYVSTGASDGVFLDGGLGGPPPDDNRIFIVTPSGVESKYAGLKQTSGSTDGPRLQALFNNPAGLAVDSQGDLFVADSGNNTLREISASGTVTTVAGSAGVSGSADGPGGQASLTDPVGVTVDAYGTLYIVGGQTVRRAIPTANTQSPIRLVNLSARGNVMPGSPLIAGFVIEGTVEQTVLVRAVGPDLALMEVPNALPAVQLAVFDHTNALVASSAASLNAADTASATALVGAFALSASSGNASMAITLKPGPYTAVVSSPTNATGAALVEVYEVP